jgi:hypothetical protein
MRRKLSAFLLAIAMLLSIMTVMPVTASADTVPAYSCGDVDGNGAITITDALEVLKFLAGIQPNISNNPQAMNAARVVEGRSEGESPVIADVLEILKLLANLNSVFDEFNCPDCDWCGEEDGGEVTTAEIADTTPETATVAATTTLQTTTATTVITTTTLQTTTTVTTTTLQTTTTPVTTTTAVPTTTTRATTTTAGVLMVSFNLNYSGAPTPPASVAVRDNGTISTDSIPTVTRQGYTFNGWWSAETGGTRITGGRSGTVFTANTTVYAQWTAAAVTTTAVTTTAPITTTTNNIVTLPGAIEIILDFNYPNSPPRQTRNTDTLGTLTMALPSPARPDSGGNRWSFAGWFTEANGGVRVMSGPTGTIFTQNTTLFARWTVITPINLRQDTPAEILSALDWIRNVRHPAEPTIFNNTGTTRRGENWMFDQIWGGDGTYNWVVRWESTQPITLAQRRNMATMLYEATNQWTRPLIGMPGWEFGEIPVTLVGWAVTDGSRILDRQPNELVWVNRDHNDPREWLRDPVRTDLMASAPSSMSRRINHRSTAFRNGTFQYSLDGTAATRGLHNRFDVYLWATEWDIRAGGYALDWGTRMRCNRLVRSAASARISTLDAQGRNVNGNAADGVLLHEIGHFILLYDLYNMPNKTTPHHPPNWRTGQLNSIMDRAGSTNLTQAFDLWMVRYYWDWFYNHPTSWNSGRTQQIRYVRPANAPER